ncbi:hypothetical protein CBLAS_0905 [Campylobacter blaseri]|uniref:Uncharacterized protein n=1 Tax=Campylobacter blaseri TaxID=2042961 RepID=A0A2P8R2Q3_9BACT|nr:hypothetical protein [Campylobacter blaseri]PSM52777.1 hypothetical protein CQ405_03370 [Campylobacter blaseri]PSM54425.1 hypothetical protein CRN67_03370 [Campylobacter blaseri]QKF86090.1 hypothetical protein CBLAS_0905 [Campylobacter blaseri]
MEKENLLILKEIDKKISLLKKRLFSGNVLIDDEALTLLKYLKIQVDEINAVGSLLGKKYGK